MTVHNKLVRDKIPEIIQAHGHTAVTRMIQGDEYYQSLLTKLVEEYEEFRESGDLEELADILEVVEALAIAKGASFADILQKKEQKQQERGGFTTRVWLERVDDK